MDKFIFRFNNILNTKEKIEDDRKNKLGISVKKLVTEQEHLNELTQKKMDIMNTWKEKTEKTVKIGEIRNLAQGLEIMQNMIEQQQQVVKQSEMDVEIKRKDLIEASKQRKIFEKLKEKDFEEFKYEQLKKEDAFTDEIVSYKAASR